MYTEMYFFMQHSYVHFILIFYSCDILTADLFSMVSCFVMSAIRKSQKYVFKVNCFQCYAIMNVH